jgi:tetratricopeptide (TPR) repeat protein
MHMADAKAQSPSSSQPAVNGLELEIASWIEKLGDPNYSVRLQAQSELERIGVRALDQLHRASFHPNPQVSSQARFLVQSNQFNWAWETDPFHVRRILTNYTTAPIYEKSAYIDQLHALEGDEGLPALCRLIRYETQGCLAKRAALLVMRSKPLLGQSSVARLESIATMVDGAMSTAGQWVLDYVAMPDPMNPDAWIRRIDAELALLKSKSPDTSVEIIADLRRWLVEHMAAIPEWRDRALAIARTIPEHFPDGTANRSTSSLEFAQWALETNLPELVQEQHGQINELSLLDPKYGYLLAESYALQSKQDIANQIAELTAVRTPVNAQGEPRLLDIQGRNGSPLNQRLEEMLQRNMSLVFERSAMGEFLIKRGRFDWAERELRLAIEGHEDDVEFATIINLTQLSQLLHELDRHGEAAAVLQKYADRYQREPMFRTQVAEQGGESLVSNYFLYSGDDARSRNETEKAREFYNKSIDLAQDNVDAIIGLYRLSDSSESDLQERRKTQQRIATSLKQEIDLREQALKQENPRFQATEQRSLANQMNTLAWLIANTEGNFEEALFLSRRACALAPNRSAYLDTLAHCYAALDRYHEAVEQQRKAVALEPHQPSLVRALQRFESELEAENNKSR